MKDGGKAAMQEGPWLTGLDPMEAQVTTGWAHGRAEGRATQDGRQWKAKGTRTDSKRLSSESRARLCNSK